MMMFRFFLSRFFLYSQANNVFLGKIRMRGDKKEKGEKLLRQCYGKHSHLLFRAHCSILNGFKLPDTFEYEMREKKRVGKRKI